MNVVNSFDLKVCDIVFVEDYVFKYMYESSEKSVSVYFFFNYGL